MEFATCPGGLPPSTARTILDVSNRGGKDVTHHGLSRSHASHLRLRASRGLGGVAAARDAAEREADNLFVHVLGVVVAEPFGHLGVVGVLGIGEDVEGIIEPGQAAAVFGRGGAFAGDQARIFDIRVAEANVGKREPMFPAVAEVVEVVEDGLARLEDLPQADALGLDRGPLRRCAGGSAGCGNSEALA